MSVLFEFYRVPHRGEQIVDRFCEKASETHTISVTRSALDGCQQVRLLQHNSDDNGGQQLVPLGHESYEFNLGIAYAKEAGQVAIFSSTGADAAAETVIHPLIDILVKILCEEFHETWFDFGESMHGDFEVPTVPCSGETLQCLLSSENQVSEVIFGRVRIGEDLIQAFACPESNNANKDLILAFRCSNIVNYSHLGQCLRQNPFLRHLVIEPKSGHNVVPLLQCLPHLEVLFLSEVCGPSLTEDQSKAMCEAILGMTNLVKLMVEQGNEDAMHRYTFDGLWEMLSRHESIHDIYFHHHSPMWTEEHVDTVSNTLRANPRIVHIEGTRNYVIGTMLEQWNHKVEPLLKMNRLQIQIRELLMQHELRYPSTYQVWLELLIDEIDSVASLDQILRETVDVLVEVLQRALHQQP